MLAAVVGAFAFVFGRFDLGVVEQFRRVTTGEISAVQPLASVAGYLAVVSMLALGLVPAFRKIMGSASLDRRVRTDLFGEGGMVGEDAIRDMVGITSDELVRIFGSGKERYSYAEHLHVRRYVRRNASIRDLRKTGVEKHLALKRAESS